MAVDLTKNPWLLDAASAGSTVLTRALLRIQMIRWTGGSVGDVAILQDASGRVVWQATFPADGDVESNEQGSHMPGGEWAGLRLAQLPHGTIQLTYA